ncbi:heparinase II/III family protein [Jeotgalicoccus sp. ATCC 8456]|uniref:heparinase II/III domain-containing protein n=1 Tax=Jeotgalicoccus sp. ATCC 8456 TaxID=946435 RepID=UPI0018E5B748|nr:heparinase II/III family protein [Jeotgalicoccus sp. ATCC 8456]QQD85670.1 alginate lyase family protein [Jeotgalicoccus sp. ATCC 8456]
MIRRVHTRMKYNYEIVKPLLYRSRNKNPVPAADDMLSKNLFALPPNGKIAIDIDNNFRFENETRSLWRLIHGHTFLGDLFDAYLQTSDMSYIYYAESILFKWFDYVDQTPEDKMIYHDETTALRLTYWLNFNYSCRDVLSEQMIIRLDKEIRSTVELLSTKEFHSTNTNHGMFQDISLMAYAILYNEEPAISKEYQLALARLKDYFYSTYTSDGVHKEHSPDYHYMVTVNVKKVVDVITSLHNEELSLDEEKLISIYKNAEEYAMHILEPSLYLPKISDCSNFQLPKRPTYYNLFPSETFQYVKTFGEEGKEPTKKQVLFKEAGYFISRSDWTKHATYFLFIASYNARYHKHSDDLSFIVYDKGELFVDSGPNGYDYDSPFTKYAYSGFAHSTLIVNNTSLPRNDDQFDKVGISNAEFEDNGDEFIVTGYNNRYTDVKHDRTIQGNHETGSFIVNDVVESPNRNEYQVLYQLSSKVSARVNGNIISIFSKKDGSKRAEIEISLDQSIKHYEIEIVEGQGHRQQSFEFPKMGSYLESSTVVIRFYNEDNIAKVSSAIELENFKVQETIIDNEEVYGNSNVKYNFYKSNSKSDSLLVVFSAMMPLYQYKYNYYATLKDIDMNQLYIKDDIGEFGNYFIGKNKGKETEADILSLILTIMTQNNISFENITLVGSSKGAFASLYFGMKYGFKNVIAGAPQTQVGNFVIDEAPHKNVGEVVSGGTDIGDKLYLNNLLYGFKPNVRNYENYFICVGTKDHHYKGHILPYYRLLKESGVDIRLDEIPDANHADLKMFFKDYIYQSLNKIYGLNLAHNSIIGVEEPELSIVDHNTELVGNTQVSLNLDILGKDYNIVYYLISDKNEVKFKSRPQKASSIVLDIDQILNSRIKIFLRSNDIVKKYITSIIRNVEMIELNQTI